MIWYDMIWYDMIYDLCRHWSNFRPALISVQEEKLDLAMVIMEFGE